MENKKEYLKIKVKSSYGTTIIKKLDSGIDIDDLMQEWRDILLGLGYSDKSINKYIELT
jgi:hypothetical protein